MTILNYHHLHYFWVVARHGNLTQAAKQLRVAQSALSTQIRQLEVQLGQALFERHGRGLSLTEAGRIAVAHAEEIFTNGQELLATLRDGVRQTRRVLRIGAVATLSRNFQESFIEPLLQLNDVQLVMHSGSLTDLLRQLKAHGLDLVLSNRRVHADATHPWCCHRLARQQVSLVGPPRQQSVPFRFPQDLSDLELMIPGVESEIRAGFDVLCERLGLRLRILAEVDDMAMLRVLARVARAASVVPTVVVRDELREGILQEYCSIPSVYENFFAITIRRRYQHPLLKTLLHRSEAEVLAMP